MKRFKRVAIGLFVLAVVSLLPGLAFVVSSSRSAHASGSDYYVSASGDDNNTGGSADPWKTLAYAANHVPTSGGITIHVAAGTYVEKSIVDLPVGVNLVGAGASSTILKADLSSADSDFANNTSNITWDTFYGTNSADGGWIRLPKVPLGTGYSHFFTRCLVSGAGASVEVHLDSPSGTQVGTLTLQKSTNPYGEEQGTTLSGASGTHDVYIVYRGSAGIARLSGFFFTNGTAGPNGEPNQVDSSTTGGSIFLNANSNGGEILRLWSDPYGIDGNQTLSGFTLDGANRTSWAGLLVRGRNNVVIHDTAYQNFSDHAARVLARSGLHQWPAQPLTGVQIYSNTFTNSSNATTTQDTGNGSSGALEIGGLRGAQIRNNTITNVTNGDGFGLKFTAGGWLYGIQVHDNSITANYRNSNNYFTMELWDLFDDCQIYNNHLVDGWLSMIFGNKGSGTDSVYIHHNFLTYTADDNFQSGVEVNISDAEIAYNIIERAHSGIIGFDGGHNANLRVHHNLIHFPTGEEDLIGSGGLGVNLLGGGGSAQDVKVYNNIFQNLDIAVNISAGTPNNIDVKNNIFMNVNTAYYGTGTNLTFANNAVQANTAATAGDATVGSGNKTITNTSDFGLTLSGNLPDPYYRLQSGSSLIDAGVDVGFPYTGSAPDIGAIENGAPTWTVGDGSPVVPPDLPPPPPAGTPIVVSATNNGGASGISYNNGVVESTDDGDWLKYRQVNLGNALPGGSGFFTANMAVADNANNAKKVEIRLDSTTGTLIGTLVVQPTGGWSTFQDETTALSGASGIHDVYLVFKGGNGVGNFKQFTFSLNRPVQPIVLSASNPNSSSGLTWDSGVMGSTDDGDWAMYQGVNFTDSIPSGDGTFSATLAVPDNPGNAKKVEVHLDSTTGPLVATLVVQGTGGWSTFQDESTALSNVSGTHDVYIVFKGGNGVGNFKQFVFTDSGNGPSEPGLKGQYYNSRDLSGSVVLTRTDTTVDFYWGGSPGTGVNAQDYSVRWTGKITPTESGDYTFTTRSDDGVRLWVNGQLVIDNWTDHSPTYDSSGSVALTAGQHYDIKMEMYNHQYDAHAHLLWTPPGGAQGVVPQSVLSTH